MATRNVRLCLHCNKPLLGDKRSYCSEACQVWFKTDIRGPDECWIWTGYTQKGYGAVMVSDEGKAKPKRTHRIAWETFHGRKMAEGMLACHSCDVRLCNNPHHIFEGSFEDNTQDMMKKGRNKAHPNPPKGADNPASKLNDALVSEILKDKRSYPDIAKSYDVSFSVIFSIKKGKTWQHVLGDRDGLIGKSATNERRRAKTAKMTPEKVRAIRADPRKYSEICNDYGISPPAVSCIKNRKTWSDVD